VLNKISFQLVVSSFRETERTHSNSHNDDVWSNVNNIAWKECYTT